MFTFYCQTGILTTGVDTISGTAGNDTITATVSDAAAAGIPSVTTLTGLDSIDGGAGTDTLNINDIAATPAGIDLSIATIANIETMNIQSINDVDADASQAVLDTTTIAGLTTLNITKSLDVYVEAANTTDINVSGANAGGAANLIQIDGGKNVSVTNGSAIMDITIGTDTNATGATVAGTITVTDTEQKTGVITVEGGTDVTVTATSTVATGNIVIGDTADTTVSPTGAVVVTQNLVSEGDALANTANSISVTGGTTVNVTVNGTITADAAADNANALTSSLIDVLGDGNTTDVTLTQTLTATDWSEAGAAATSDTEVLTFKALTTGQSTTVDGLTFTATKTLLATEVAAAFANLTSDDTQANGGVTANGYYTGVLGTTSVTSGAASSASVTFTSPQGTGALTVTTTGATAVGSAYTAGTPAGADATADVSVVYNDVSVADDAAAAIKNVTLSGFGDADLVGALNAIETLSLTNSAGATVLQTAQTALALTVNAITGTVDLDNSAGDENITDLTLTATGVASTFGLTAAAVTDLTVNAAVALDVATGSDLTALENVTIAGAGAVDLGDISTSVALDSFTAAGNNGGVTATVETEIDAAAITGSITEYIFSAGNDVVTLSNDIIETKVTLGAGDDTLELATATGIADVVAVISGGTGTNIIDMDAADAETLSGDATFETKMDGFSKLSVRQVANDADNTVNLANMDDISYVISAGTSDTAEVTTVTITVDTPIVANNTVSITIDGVTYTTAALAGAATATDIATALDTAIGASSTAAAGVLTITGTAGRQVSISGLTVNLGTAVTAGAISSVDAVTSSELLITNMANDGTLELTAAGMGATVTMTDASGSADTLNVVIGNEAGNVGTVAAAGVETIDVTTTDTFTDTTGATDIFGNAIADGLDDANSSSTVYLTGDVLTTVNVTGAGDLSVSSSATTLTLIDGSTMTGALTATSTVANQTIKGGSAVDTLAADSSNAQIYGNGGNDNISATTDGVSANLWGGAGSDTFDMTAAISSLTQYATIEDALAGDVIILNTDNFIAGEVAITDFDQMSLTDKFNAVLGDTTLNDGTNDFAISFETSGNTYIVVSDGTVGYSSTDQIIKLTGSIDLSVASFNATYGTLEIA